MRKGYKLYVENDLGEVSFIKDVDDIDEAKAKTGKYKAKFGSKYNFWYLPAYMDRDNDNDGLNDVSDEMDDMAGDFGDGGGMEESTGCGSASGQFSVGLGLKPIKKSLPNPDQEDATLNETDTSSSGQYSQPAIWAKNKKNWRGKVMKYFKDSKFVHIKDKCKKFPYCDQGAGAIELSDVSKEKIDNNFKKTNENTEMKGRVLTKKQMNEEIAKLNAETKKAQTASGKTNKEGLKLSDKNVKSLEKDNSKDKEFTPPKKNIGLTNMGGEEKKYNETLPKEVDQYETTGSGLGLEDTVYSSEPGKRFQERAKEGMTGSSRMGNRPDDDNEESMDGNKKVLDKAKKRSDLRDKLPFMAGLGDVQFLNPKEVKTKPKYTIKENSVIFEESIEDYKDFSELIPEEFKSDENQIILEDGNLKVNGKWEGNAESGSFIMRSFDNQRLLQEQKEQFNKIINFTRKTKK